MFSWYQWVGRPQDVLIKNTAPFVPDTKLNQHELTRSTNEAIVNSTNKISYYVHINSSMIFWVNRNVFHQPSISIKKKVHLDFRGSLKNKTKQWNVFWTWQVFEKTNRLTFQKTMTWIYPPRRIQISIMIITWWFKVTFLGWLSDPLKG